MEGNIKKILQLISAGFVFSSLPSTRALSACTGKEWKMGI